MVSVAYYRGGMAPGALHGGGMAPGALHGEWRNGPRCLSFTW